MRDTRDEIFAGKTVIEINCRHILCTHLRTAFEEQASRKMALLWMTVSFYRRPF